MYHLYRNLSILFCLLVQNVLSHIHLNTKDTGLYGKKKNQKKPYKLDQKVYRHHSGYIGGMKETIARDMLAVKPEKALMLAIKGMLPKNSLGRQTIKKLRIYAGSEHENQAQKPEIWKF